MIRCLALSPLLLAACATLGGKPSSIEPPQGATQVRIDKGPGGYTLVRGGKPYLIRGAGGTGARADLLRLGANSIRTWGADDLGVVLDQAQRDGLTVTAGIWLGHADVFDYHDADLVAKQLAMCREVVERHKNHPALLMWAFGNEMEGYAEADDPAVWKAINAIAEMSKTVDPDHPTMTVIAEVGGQRVPNVHRYCPAIDVVGINSYGGAPTLVERYRKQGGTKPIVLTEFGPPGPWESPKTPWNAPIEMSSTEKAKRYRQAYEAAVLQSQGLSLGSYAFLWGHKQEATATWFGMLLKDGSRVAAADVMSELWTGKPPANRCPEIASLALSKTAGLRPGELVTGTLSASDPEGDPLQVRWVLSGEVAKYLTAGRDEAVPDDYPDALVRSDPSGATFKMPPYGGAYRVFVTVTDGHGGAAVANVPLFVDGPPPPEPGPKVGG